MTGTMTLVGMDVHARSTHAAALNLMSGEIQRAGSIVVIQPARIRIRALPLIP